MLSIAVVWYTLRLLMLTTEEQKILTEIPAEKLLKRNQNSRLSWVSLIGLRTTRPWVFSSRGHYGLIASREHDLFQ